MNTVEPLVALQALAERRVALGDAALTELLSRLRDAVIDFNAHPSAEAEPLVARAFPALAVIDDDRNSEALVACHIEIARYLHAKGGEIPLEPALEGVRRARLLGSRPLLHSALTVCGATVRDRGNVPLALELFAEAIDQAVESDDVTWQCVTLLDVALCYAAASQYEEAMGVLGRVVAAVDATTPDGREVIAHAYTHEARICFVTEEFARGLKSALLAIELTGEPSTPVGEATLMYRHSIAARLLLEFGNIESARDHVRASRYHAGRLPPALRTTRTVLLADVAEALCEVYAGMVDVGLTRLTAIMERTRALRVARTEALAAMIRACDVAGRPEQAKVYRRELLLFMKQSQKEFLLQHQRFQIDGSGHSNSDADHREVAVPVRSAYDSANLAVRYESMVGIAITAELRDDPSGTHLYRVARLAALLARRYGCDDQTCLMVEFAARLHDIGKLAIPDTIFFKAGALADDERAVMRTHAPVGAEYIDQSDIPCARFGADIARFHHEWWDGSGYPYGISGFAIPTPARIVAVADVFDALTHDRPYRSAVPVADALQLMSQLRGRQFEPVLVDLLVDLVRDLQAQTDDLDAYLGDAARSSRFNDARERLAVALDRPATLR